MQIDMFSILRTLHILVAALWLGAAALLTIIILPAIRTSGATGNEFIAEAVRRGLPKFMASVAGLTVLSGLILYWQWAGMVGPAGTHGTGAIMLMVGALAGVAAAIIGGAILAPAAKKLAALALESSADDSRQSRMVALHQRMATATKFALTLLVIALLLMSMSRFG